MSAAPAEAIGGQQIPSVGIRGNVSCQMWVLGTGFQFSAKAIVLLTTELSLNSQTLSAQWR